jgi:hypothetical protein
MLKKIAVIIAIVAFATNSFAAAILSSTTDAFKNLGIAFTPSKSVVLGYEGGIGGAVAGSTKSTYSIASKNTAGDRVYGTTSASTAIVQSVGAAGQSLTDTDHPTLPTTPSDSTIAGGHGYWSLL